MDRYNYDELILSKIEKSYDLLVPFGGVVSLISAFIMMDNPEEIFVYVDFVLGFLLLLSYLLRKKLNVRIKIITVSLVINIVGVFALSNSGFSGTGLELILMSNLIVVSFLSKKQGITFSVVSIVMILFVPLFLTLGIIPSTPYNTYLDSNFSEWSIHILLTILFFVILHTIVTSIKSYLIQKINETSEHAEKIYSMAYYDQLTELPNRYLFLDKLSLQLDRHNASGFLVLLDIKGLNLINSVYGNTAGDELLKTIALTLSYSTSKDELCARTGGNEFAWWCKLSTEALLTERIKLLQVRLDEKFVDFSYSKRLDFNASFIHYPTFGSSASDLLQKATLAIEYVRTHKNNMVIGYDKNIEEQTLYEMSVKDLLSSAVRNKEFQIYYQEKVDTRTQTVVGVEALARWFSSSLGTISPSVFIPIVEKADFAVPFGDLIITTVFNEMPALIEKYGTDITVSINISPSHMASPHFYDFVIYEAMLRNIDPNNVIFEITEETMIEGVELITEVINRLHLQGFAISLDDFGTGYSSLSYLTQLDIDELKIDSSFIVQLGQDHRIGTLLNAIIQLKDTYGFIIVAEGVETQSQCDALSELGCHIIQGFLFSKPLPIIQT